MLVRAVVVLETYGTGEGEVGEAERRLGFAFGRREDERSIYHQP